MHVDEASDELVAQRFRNRTIDSLEAMREPERMLKVAEEAPYVWCVMELFELWWAAVSDCRPRPVGLYTTEELSVITQIDSELCTLYERTDCEQPIAAFLDSLEAEELRMIGRMGMAVFGKRGRMSEDVLQWVPQRACDV